MNIPEISRLLGTYYPLQNQARFDSLLKTHWAELEQGWALTPSALQWICHEIEAHPNARWCELGGGLSTVFVQAYQPCPWVTIEHDPQWAARSRTAGITVREVPLQEHFRNDKVCSFYDLESLPEAEYYIVDGPHGHGRSAAYPLIAKNHLPADILIDDVDHYPFLWDAAQSLQWDLLPVGEISPWKRWVAIRANHGLLASGAPCLYVSSP